MATVNQYQGKQKKIVLGVLGIAALLFFLFSIGSLWENVDNGDIVVIQMPVSGNLKIIKTGGTFWQGFGKVTKYKKSYQYWFSKSSKEGGAEDESIKTRFNDGGHAFISGSIRVDMPLDDSAIVALHTKYGSQEAIEKQLIGQRITNAVYMTAPMMSSKESYADRRNDLISYVEDQAINGVYKTYVENTKTKDAMDTSTERTVAVVKIRMGADGLPLRQEVSPTLAYHLKLYGLVINAIDYDQVVEKQIASQQQALMQVQTAIANAKRAEQERYTAEQQGQADATKKEWAQKAENATIIAEAEGRKLAATQDALAAEQEKKANILRGEGEGAYKRAVMQANGALEQKLATYEKVQTVWANAFKDFKGNIVPTVQSGGSGASNGALNFQELMSMKAAHDLGLDLSNQKK